MVTSWHVGLTPLMAPPSLSHVPGSVLTFRYEDLGFTGEGSRGVSS